MDDKFILMNLDDERSKKIAEVMGNATCKNILNYLGDIKEASQKDISDALNIPINTVEYNLKKLIEAGLAERTKNFFWSVKGKKIPMYKLAKKHIVISPKFSRPNLTTLKTILPIIIAVGLLIVFLAIQNTLQDNEKDYINKFNSEAELKSFIKKNQVTEGFLDSFANSVPGIGRTQKSMEFADAGASSSSGTSDYSTTNIQVQGVDEADIVKNDGKYIYTAIGNTITIVDAYPANNMKILSEINISGVREIFINGDKLVIFSLDYKNIDDGLGKIQCVRAPCGRSETFTMINIYDISDRENPELEHEVSMTGDYLASRMIGDYVYVVANQYIYDDIVYPMVSKNGVEKTISASDISYAPIRDYNYQFTNILGIDLSSGETNSETTLTGTTGNVYVSEDNIYTTQYKYGAWYSDMEENSEKTIIHKTSINKLDIKYVSSGEVPGNILNQFSMDENNNEFRIATTTRSISNMPVDVNKRGVEISPQQETQNNLYILDENLKIIGKLEYLAPGESIYSVRFIGNRAYMVTFKRVDPLFVIDLSDSTDPTILGKLKIPGYSDYLHPYDENHIIGIGKDAEASEYGDFALYQGVKIALFDVTDPNNPIEMHKVNIGDRGTQSEALQDHKAFLFDRQKELLVIPITLAEVQGDKTSGSQYGEQTFQGAYVYNLNLEEGFKLKNRITHITSDEELKRGYYFDYNTNIRRSLYMDNILYTISNKKIKANNLNSTELDEISTINLSFAEDKGYYGVE